MRYDAFISYRHTPLDMEMAKKLHKALETYRIPKAVQKKTGRKKINRVFRDQEELPIGSDLNENIGTALEGSDYLVVVCSPNTPGSEWVAKEIDTFIKLHGRSHVLAMLIEGEPNESFPPALLVDEKGVPVEPLAADVRGETPKERNKKLKTELLRLVAAILGCNYDDLRQRHRERVLRKTIAISAGIGGSVALAGVAFGLYSSNVARQMKALADENARVAAENAQIALEKTQLADEILEEYRDKQKNQSRFLAQNALALLEQGDRRAAVLMASEGLPAPDRDRPYVAEAEYALGEALYAYDMGTDRKMDRVLRSDYTVSDLRVSADGGLLISQDLGGNIMVWREGTWELLCEIPPRISERNYVTAVNAADADETGIYVVDEDGLCKYAYDGTLLYQIESEGFPKDVKLSTLRERSYFITTKEICAFDSGTGEVLEVWTDAEEDANIQRCVYDDERDLLVCGCFAGLLMEEPPEHAKFLIFREGEVISKETDCSYLLKAGITGNGNIAVLSCNEDFITAGVQDMTLELFSSEGTLLWSRKPGMEIETAVTFSSNLDTHSYERGGIRYDSIVISAEHRFQTYDEFSGELLTDLTLPGDIVTCNISKGGPTAYLGYSTGDLVPVHCENGTIYQDYVIGTDRSIRKVVFIGETIALTSLRSTDVLLLSLHPAKDLESLSTVSSSMSYLCTSQEGGYFVLKEYNGPCVFYDFSGQEIYSAQLPEGTILETAVVPAAEGICEETTAFLQRDRIIYADPAAGTREELVYEDLGIEASYTDVRIAGDGRLAVLWFGRKVAVLDLQRRECIHTGEADGFIGNAAITGDAGVLFLSCKDAGLSSLDLESGAKKSFPKECDPIGDLSNGTYLEVSHDGLKLAVFCRDGNLRVINLATGTFHSTIPVPAKSNTFVTFSDDDRYLIFQGDDYRLRIWDLEEEGYANIAECYLNLKDVICDPQDGRTAVTDGYEVWLFENEGYGLSAYVPNACSYLTKENAFLLKKNGDLARIPYKNYEVLLQEAREQFPGAAFTEEEKAEYNIDDAQIGSN
ncbi:MAG: TIR domain-containing protein [Lachnospiraceae bacterium]|nr:TIR domain-containing protein [Lachnospiraceae bacterium]